MIARTFVTPFQGLSDVVTETQGVAVVPQITSSFHWQRSSYFSSKYPDVFADPLLEGG